MQPSHGVLLHAPVRLIKQMPLPPVARTSPRPFARPVRFIIRP